MNLSVLHNVDIYNLFPFHTRASARVAPFRAFAAHRSSRRRHRRTSRSAATVHMRRAARLARDALARARASSASFAETSTSASAFAPRARVPNALETSRDRSLARGFTGAWRAFHASASIEKRNKRQTVPLTLEDMEFERVEAVEDARRRLAPTEGTLYGVAPKTWTERERDTLNADEEAKLDALLSTYVEGAYVEGSGMPTFEEVLAGAEASAANDDDDDDFARDSSEGEDEDGDKRGGDHESMIRVPIRDVAGRSYGTGKRKTAVARVWLAPGSGEHKVNGKPYDEYFSSPAARADMVAPFFVSDTLGLFTAVVDVRGGGISGQAQAVRHGVSVALQNYDPAFRPALKAAGYLKRDPRIVERKKPGKAKARKSFAWVKR